MLASSSTSSLGRPPQRTKAQVKAMETAVLGGDAAALLSLLEESDTGVETPLTFWSYKAHDELGLPSCTLLHLAAYRGSLASVRALLAVGADPGATDGVGRLPADVCTHGGVLEALEAEQASFVACPQPPARPSAEPPKPAPVRRRIVFPGGRASPTPPSPNQSPSGDGPSDKVAAMLAAVERERVQAAAKRQEDRASSAAAFLALRQLQAQLADEEAALGAALDHGCRLQGQLGEAKAALTAALEAVEKQADEAQAAAAMLDDTLAASAAASAAHADRVREAAHTVSRAVTPAALREAQALLDPPPALKQVLQAVCVLVGVEDAPPSPDANFAPKTLSRDASSATVSSTTAPDPWPACRAVIRGDDFVQRILAVQPSTVALEDAEAALGRVDKAAAERASAIGAPLHAWASAMVAAACVAQGDARGCASIPSLNASAEAAADAFARAKSDAAAADMAVSGLAARVQAAYGAAMESRAKVVDLRVQCGQPLSGMWDGEPSFCGVLSAAAAVRERETASLSSSSRPRLASDETSLPSPRLDRVRRLSAVSADTVATVSTARRSSQSSADSSNGAQSRGRRASLANISSPLRRVSLAAVSRPEDAPMELPAGAGASADSPPRSEAPVLGAMPPRKPSVSAPATSFKSLSSPVKAADSEKLRMRASHSPGGGVPRPAAIRRPSAATPSPTVSTDVPRVGFSPSPMSAFRECVSPTASRASSAEPSPLHRAARRLSNANASAVSRRLAEALAFADDDYK